jgi:hypothetical protein
VPSGVSPVVDEALVDVDQKRTIPAGWQPSSWLATIQLARDDRIWEPMSVCYAVGMVRNPVSPNSDPNTRVFPRSSTGATGISLHSLQPPPEVDAALAYIFGRAKKRALRGLRLAAWNAGLALSATLVGVAFSTGTDTQRAGSIVLVALFGLALGLDTAHVSGFADDVETMVRLGRLLDESTNPAAPATSQAPSPEQREPPV